MNNEYLAELTIGMQNHNFGRSDKLDGIDVVNEYELIQKKQSNHPRMVRDLIEYRYTKAVELYPKYAAKREAERAEIEAKKAAEKATANVID